ALIAEAETAAALCKVAAAKDISPTHRFDRDTMKAIARVNARESAFNVASRGLKLVAGSAENVGALAESVELSKIESKQRGNTEDMDTIAAKLNEHFKAK
ncbi:MAG TPA: hypothetical protein PLL10_03040, partial [Elusimicrobiales bacterium]|nr:hypothetical protein [Elusimicrobiales bacterium]